MKKTERIIGFTIIILAILFAAAYLFLSLLGKPILAGQIKSMTSKKTTIGYFGFSPTMRLEIRDLNIEGLAKVELVQVSPNLLGFLRGKLVFNSLKLINPEFTFSKAPAAQVSNNKTSKDNISAVPVKPKEIRILPLGFKRLKIKDGKFNFIDQSISPDGIKIVLKDINCNVSNLYFYPTSAVTNFELNGKIPWRAGEAVGKVDLEGWINHFKKDMRATLKIKDIDAVYLYPYYAYWVDLEKARIEKAKLNFASDINGLNNNLTADCHLELTDMVRKPLEPGEQEARASRLTDRVLDMFKTIDQGRVELNFCIKTKMDNPQFGFTNFKVAFEDKIIKGRSATGFKAQDTLAFPVKMVESGVKSFTDLTRAMVDGVFAIGNEIGKAAQDAIKKDFSAAS